MAMLYTLDLAGLMDGQWRQALPLLSAPRRERALRCRLDADSARLTGAGLLLCSRMLPSREVLNGVNWQLLVLFIALFVVTGAFVNQGLGDAMLGHLDAWGVDLDNPLQLAAITAFMSNAINNSATVMLLVKVVDLSSPLNCCALALANAFAGNLLNDGSLANIIAAQCAENFNLKIGFFNFLKYGAPTALISLLILFGWLLLCTAFTA